MPTVVFDFDFKLWYFLNMEYQSFFILIKRFIIDNNKFTCVKPLVTHGFVQIKKEQQQYSIIIQINNFIKPTTAFLVSSTNIAKIQINSATTIARVSFEVSDNACFFMPEYNLFACKYGTNGCYRAYGLITEYKQTKNNKTTLEKIFGTVYDTYFFDCIKPKLARLFMLGSGVPELCKKVPCSKWVSVKVESEDKVFGVVYKNNFAYAIGVGSSVMYKTENLAKTYVVENKNYNILFLSASDGKIISF